MDKSAVISAFSQFAPLSEDEAAFIRARLSPVEVAARAYLMRSGEVAQQVYFVCEGCVRVVIENTAGEEFSCHFSAEGAFVSNYESFLSGQPSAYSLQACEDSRLWAIDRMGLGEVYQHVRHGERIGRLIAEGLFVDALNRITSFYLDTPEQRYATFLRLHGHLAARLPQHYIASYVGVRPQSLSRIKRRAMESEGAIPATQGAS